MLNVPVIILFSILIVLVCVLALNKRVLFKLGARNFVRHRTHSVLVVVGLLVGTAIISGAMVTGDSINYFIVKETYDSLGLVDVEVNANRSAYFNEGIFWELKNNTEVEKYNDGIAPTIVTTIAIEDNTSGQFEPAMTLIGFNPDEDHNFGSFAKTTGGTTYGNELLENEIILNEKAATKLNAKVQDLIKLRYLPVNERLGKEREFTVKYIAKDEGKAQFGSGMNVFLNLAVAQNMLNVSGKINLIKVSAKGDVMTGVENSGNVAKALKGAISLSIYDDAKILKVSEIKKTLLDLAKMIGDMISMFLTIFGSFSIIAGVILIINIFTMLAEERKSELGMSRAMGMKKRHLMQMFMFEGSTYAIAASALGTFAGLIVAWSLIYGINNVFTIGAFGGIPFHYEVSSLINAFCIGTIITFLTILVASWRVTNVNIVRAIRDIDEPVLERVSKRTALFGGIFIVISILIFLGGFENLYIRYLAPCFAIMGFALMLRYVASSRIVFSIAGLCIIAYTMYSVTTFFRGYFRECPVSLHRNRYNAGYGCSGYSYVQLRVADRCDFRYDRKFSFYPSDCENSYIASNEPAF